MVHLIGVKRLAVAMDSMLRRDGFERAPFFAITKTYIQNKSKLFRCSSWVHYIRSFPECGSCGVAKMTVFPKTYGTTSRLIKNTSKPKRECMSERLDWICGLI